MRIDRGEKLDRELIEFNDRMSRVQSAKRSKSHSGVAERKSSIRRVRETFKIMKIVGDRHGQAFKGPIVKERWGIKFRQPKS